MADYGFYWKNFAKDAKRGDWPVKAWYSNDDQLAKRMEAGDRIWLFTSGDACGQTEAKAGYLAEILFIQKVIKNPGEDREYPTGQFHYLIIAEPERAYKIDPPLLADALIRPEGHGKDEPIGRLMQKPRKLQDAARVKLQELLKAERPETAAPLAL